MVSAWDFIFAHQKCYPHDAELVKSRLIWIVTWSRGELDAKAERGIKVNINSKVVRI